MYQNQYGIPEEDCQEIQFQIPNDPNNNVNYGNYAGMNQQHSNFSLGNDFVDNTDMNLNNQNNFNLQGEISNINNVQQSEQNQQINLNFQESSSNNMLQQQNNNNNVQMNNQQQNNYEQDDVDPENQFQNFMMQQNYQDMENNTTQHNFIQDNDNESLQQPHKFSYDKQSDSQNHYASVSNNNSQSQQQSQYIQEKSKKINKQPLKYIKLDHSCKTCEVCIKNGYKIQEQCHIYNEKLRKRKQMTAAESRKKKKDQLKNQEGQIDKMQQDLQCYKVQVDKFKSSERELHEKISQQNVIISQYQETTSLLLSNLDNGFDISQQKYQISELNNQQKQRYKMEDYSVNYSNNSTGISSPNQSGRASSDSEESYQRRGNNTNGGRSYGSRAANYLGVFLLMVCCINIGGYLNGQSNQAPVNNSPNSKEGFQQNDQNSKGFPNAEQMNHATDMDQFGINSADFPEGPMNQDPEYESTSDFNKKSQQDQQYQQLNNYKQNLREQKKLQQQIKEKNKNKNKKKDSGGNIIKQNTFMVIVIGLIYALVAV